jgi:hypothetical protein
MDTKSCKIYSHTSCTSQGIPHLWIVKKEFCQCFGFWKNHVQGWAWHDLTQLACRFNKSKMSKVWETCKCTFKWA